MVEPPATLARAVLYHGLARAFAYPDAALRREIAEGDLVAELQAAQEAIGSGALAGPLAALAAASAELAAVPLDLAEEHTYLFSRQVASSPYEGSYAPDQAFGRARSLAELGALYATFGLRLGERGRELPDHVGVELEFLSWLCAKESHALAQGWGEQASICREARARFVREHPGRWLPELANRLAERGRLSFYPALAALAAAALATDEVG